MAACRVLESPIHDGQMPVQDTKTDGTNTTVTKYGVGARGIDLVTKKVNSGSETFGFPLYDVHGNMVATLARSGSNSYTTGNTVEYDVWGGTRSGSSTVDQKYCANLGHRSDSENGLQYMRARYYDPSAGRFVSEDPARAGSNWMTYCHNLPTCRVDATGKDDDASHAFGQFLFNYGRVIMAVGLAVFVAGMVNFYMGEAARDAGAAMGGILGAMLQLAGLLRSLYATIVMEQGANALIRGAMVTEAGKILMALGDDGWEEAATFLGAGAPNFLSGILGLIEREASPIY